MAVAAVAPVDLTPPLPAARTLTAADLDGLVEELAAYHRHFAPLFRRPEQRAWAAVYLRGLLTADVPRKNVEALALRLLGAGPAADRQVRAMQQFVGAGGWDDAGLLAAHQRLVDETLGEGDGVLIIDGHETPKQGTHSVGVARQWCGHTGKKDNCQAGVYLGYASRRGYTLLDRRLYLPAAWFTPDYAERRWACGIPRGTPFRTKHELAGALVEGVVADGRLPARWVVADEGYGDSPALLDRWAATGLWYLAEVARDTQLWVLAAPDGQTPQARPARWVPPQTASRKGPVPAKERLHPASPAKQRADEWAALVPAARWRRYRLLEGSKGPLVAEFVAVRVVAVRDRLPGPEGWLLVRRRVPTDGEDVEYKYYLSNAPAATPLGELVRVSGMRWPIEACFAEGGQELGLDDYEVRSWRGWHHHTTLVILAHHFLVRLQRRLDPREGGSRAGARPPARRAAPAGAAGAAAAAAAGGAERGRGAGAAARAAAPAGVRRPGRPGLAGLSAAPQAGRLSRPPSPPPTPPGGM
ncbi:MAG TPA: IS701 family transposase [Thermomicrobiales bacterium]|nr:IS701 family transposase [Thermomicrobiales bacterium]